MSLICMNRAVGTTNGRLGWDSWGKQYEVCEPLRQRNNGGEKQTGNKWAGNPADDCDPSIGNRRGRVHEVWVGGELFQHKL
jgi:hypothetical protein